MSNVTASETRQVYDMLARRANTGAAGLPLFADGMPDLRLAVGVPAQIANASVPLPLPGLRANDYMHQLVDMANNASPSQAEAYHFYLCEAALLVNAELLTAYPDAQNRPADVQAVIELNKRLMDEYLPHVREELDLARDQQESSLLEPLWLTAQAVEMLSDMPLPEAKDAIARFAGALEGPLREAAYPALNEMLEQQLGIENAAMIPELLRDLLAEVGDAPITPDGLDKLAQALDMMEQVSDGIATIEVPPVDLEAYQEMFQDVMDLADELGMTDEAVESPAPESEIPVATDMAAATETETPDLGDGSADLPDAPSLPPELATLFQALGVVPMPVASNLGVTVNFSPDANQAGQGQGPKPDAPLR